MAFIKEVAIAVAGLGTAAGVGSAVVLPIIDATPANTRNDLTVRKEEPKDPVYWEKEIRYQMKLTKDRVSVSSPLWCSKKDKSYAFFSLREQDGKKEVDLVCDYVEEKKDLGKTEVDLGGYKVKVECSHTGDTNEIKNYECTVTTTKPDMQLRVKPSDTSKVTLYWQ
ncbi:hypothetical protein MHLP_01110 [Candidatus Mycoplasma haematolamae str. Purdue]|uniref:Uncharacterized protein n=1 Tax=Mycoplasma haematolamae (strain Purdue) TaxID=1212765 RepID=I7C5L6_MYCHA|nr:hypothetical protein [Candidatus Mycoplasma haematolamae]AFO51802.1 hypothetical protein MHLP_01110 [Candidatus Mycoplasma haematolamae str. Purdue]